MSEELAVKSDTDETLSIIERVALDPRVDVEKLERLLAMKERVLADQRRVAFVEAMSRLAPTMPEIDKNGRVTFEGKGDKPGMDRRYARLEDIDRAIRPLYSKEGFSLSWNTQPGENGKIRVIGTLSHSGGHFEQRQLDLPHDSSGAKNPIQAVGSTVSYGKRMITTMFFNLIARDEDTDGNNLNTITDDQVKDLQAAMDELKMNKQRFLLFMGVGAVNDILARDWGKAMNAVEVQRQSLAKK